MSSTSTDGTCTRDSEMSNSDSDEETDNNEADSDASSEDSDLQDLYDSFDFEDGTSQTRLQTEGLEKCSSTSGGTITEALLYPGADLSTLQSYLLLFQFAIRHSLTSKAFTELLQLLIVHLPRGACIPRSVHSFKRFFVDSFPESRAIQHSYGSCY